LQFSKWEIMGTSQLTTEIKEHIDDLNDLAWTNVRNHPVQIFSNTLKNLATAEEYGYIEGIADCFSILGASLLWQSDYANAIENCMRAKRIYEGLKFHARNGRVDYTVGTIFFYLSDYENALKSYISSLKNYELDKDYIGIADAHNGIGSVYYAIDENEKALQYLYKSLEMCEELGAHHIKQKVLDGIGTANLNLRRYEEAKQALLQCVKVIEDHSGSDHVKAHAYNNLGNVLLFQENFNEALSYFNRSLYLREKAGFKSGAAACIFNIGRVFMMQGELKSAENSFLTALQIAEESSTKDVLSKICEMLSELYTSLGDTEKGLHFYKRFHKIHESIKNENTGRRTKSIELSFKMEQERSERELLEQQNENLKRYSDDLVILSEIGKDITAILSTQKIIETAYERINVLMDASCFGLAIYDENQNTLNYPWFVENGELFQNITIPAYDRSRLAGICFTDQVDILIQHFSVDYSKWLPNKLILVGKQTESIIYVPFEIPGGEKGVITVQSEEINSYTHHHVNMLRSLSIYIGIALRNAQLYAGLENTVTERTKEVVQQKEEIEKSFRLTALLSDVGKQLTSSTDFNSIFLNLHKHVSELMDAPCFGVRLYHPDKARVEYKFEIEKGVVDEEPFSVSTENINNYSVICVLNNKPIVINDNLNEYHLYTKEIVVPTGEMPHSLIFYPMAIGERVIGLITVQSFQKHAYTQEHVDILKTLASFTAIALDNVNIMENLEEKVDQRTREILEKKEELEKAYQNTQLLNEIGRKITSSLSISRVIEEIYATLNTLLDASIIGVGIHNPKTNTIDVKGAMEDGEILPDFSFDLEEDNELSVTCFIHQREIIINEFSNELLNYVEADSGVKVGSQPESIIYIPLIAKDEAIGVLTIQSFNTHAYSDYHVSIVRSIALYAATAIENAGFYAEMEAKVDERTVEVVAQKEEILKAQETTRLLSEIGQEIISTHSLDAIFETIYERVHQLMDATIFSIRICDWEKQVIHYSYTIEKGRRLAQHVISMENIDNYTVWSALNRKDIFIEDHVVDYKKYTKQIVVVDGELPDSLIFCPMIINGNVIGVITAQSFEKHAYKQHHLDILRSLATYSAIALENARLYGNLEETVKARTAEVVQQKEIIEEKNRDITASIRYAQRLQKAILPARSLFDETFQDSFIWFKPKDMVSGDFYWLERIENKIYFAVVDCTGHGVPGAIVSMVGANALNRCLAEFNLRKPSEILDTLTSLVISKFDRSETEVKDGMDIALCCLDCETNTIEFAGAYNPLWIIKKENPIQLLEIKPDKQPIGHYFNHKPFTLNQLQLEKGDRIYLFSDGFSDQFGGETPEERNVGGKKIKSHRMKSLLLENQHLSMTEQQDVLKSFFKSWKGELEQVDDICVMGITL
jgi:transcriptional regulator with GAF, ATPase, and Fis domain